MILVTITSRKRTNLAY